MSTIIANFFTLNAARKGDEMPEPDDRKLSRPVLRGERGRKPSDLLGTEKIIDLVWDAADIGGRRTAYSRKKARANYLKIAKQRKPRKLQIQRAIKDQLSYVARNLEALDNLGIEIWNILKPKHLIRLGTIRKVVGQQSSMLENKSHTVEDRIVSLRQPHVRPIVRGKARSPVEFGQKISLSVVRGYTFIEKQRWDNFSEGKTLIESADEYKARHGVYPKVIQADMTYRNRENLSFCKQNGIRLSGPRLGRPKKAELEADRELAYRDSCERNMVEGRHGIAKRRYGLDLIMTRLVSTSETEAALNILVMNVAHLMRALLRFFSRLPGDRFILGINTNKYPAVC
jgi:hypothetical protein